MDRKLVLLLLLCFGLTGAAKAQTVVHDSVSIYMPYGTDTTCPGTQLTFTAIQSVDTFTSTTYRWFTDGTYTGVSIDTFYSTAVTDGDSVWCWIYYTDALGDLDSAMSNIIVIHRSDTIPPRVVISLTAGSNPGCGAAPLTFTAYPVNGGSAPSLVWNIDRDSIAGEDSTTFTRYFSNNDTVTCQMISNSTCSAPYNDTVLSSYVVVVHDSLTAMISISAAANPICAGELDSFMAVTGSSGIGATLSWYVDSTLIPTALSPTYVTSTLHDGDIVYAVLNAPDPCVINHTTVSNVVTMTVISLLSTSVAVSMTHGSNPGCLDSTVTLTPFYFNFGSHPSYAWFVNGVEVSTDSVLDTVFNNSDHVAFRVYETDNGCYTNDTVVSSTMLMIRDSTPATPWLSLIDNHLQVNNGGSYIWYRDSVVIPGIVAQTYHPVEDGYYYVIKDSANCPSLPSNVIYISLLQVNNVVAANAKIYPNPTNDILNLDWDKPVADLQIDVYNVLGQSMMHDVINNSAHHELHMGRLPEGNYTVVLHDEQGNKATFKIFHNN
jgi:Secretion system C-terminal sorting domain